MVAPEDLAAVAAKVLIDGPELHHKKQYWLSREVLNGAEVAGEISQGLGQSIKAAVLTPDDLLAQITSGAAVEDLTGRKPCDHGHQGNGAPPRFGGAPDISFEGRHFRRRHRSPSVAV
jgi:hypothetical protein